MPLDVHVVTPERELWSGEASTVVARGVAGEVGILSGHAPMMVGLAIGPLRILRSDGPEITAVVDGGFMHVTSDGDATRVDVLAANADSQCKLRAWTLNTNLQELRGYEDEFKRRREPDSTRDFGAENCKSSFGLM